MVTVFVICWGPYAGQSMAGVMGYVSHSFTYKLVTFSHLQNIPLALSVFPLQFAKLAVLANPLIYVIMNKTVRHISFYRDFYQCNHFSVPESLHQYAS